MADGFYKQIRKIIKKHGFQYLENAKGSHEKWRNPDSGLTIIVPRNLNSRHTANAILKSINAKEKI